MDQRFTYQHPVQDSTIKNWKRQEPYCLVLQDIHSQIHCLESHVQHQNHESFLCLPNWECLWNARCWLGIIKYGKSGCSNHFRSPYKQTGKVRNNLASLSLTITATLFLLAITFLLSLLIAYLCQLRSGKRTFSFVWRERFMKMQCYLMEYEKIKQ